MSVGQISKSNSVAVTEVEEKEEAAKESEKTNSTASSSASSFKLNEHGKCGWQPGGCHGASGTKVRKHPAE